LEVVAASVDSRIRYLSQYAPLERQTRKPEYTL